jgi:DNA-binding transcriptional regulator YhcF (GntR family)
MAQLTEHSPIFQQIAELLEDAILSGAYEEETQIPSITEFATTYKINPATALKGVTLLVEEDLLYKRRGLGMFVREGAKSKLLKKRREEFAVTYISPLVKEATRLELSKEDVLEMLERRWK